MSERMTAAEVEAISRRNRAARRAITVEPGKERCPLCEKWFTASGLRIHFGRAHPHDTPPWVRFEPSKRKPGYEDRLAEQCRTIGLPPCELEYRFHETRDWRIDCAWPSVKLAVEIDGAVHRIKERFYGDIEKHQALFFAGWKLLRVSTRQVSNGEAAKLITKALELLR